MDPPLQQIQKMQLLLLKHDIHLFPQGFENSQEKIQELIQIINDDKDFNDNLQCEVDKFLSLDAQQFKQVLDYDAHFQLYKEYDDKLVEYNKFQEKIKEAQNKIKDIQKDIPNVQAYIHNYLIRDQDQVQLMEDIFMELNQYKAQAIQEIENINRQHILELRTLHSPPEVMLKVSEMMIILLNNCSGTQNNVWQQFKGMLANHSEFIQQMMNFKVDQITLNQLTIARSLFEDINQQQCQRCSSFAYRMYKWCFFQFQIVNILNTFQIGIEDLIKHKQAVKFQETIQEMKSQILKYQQSVQEFQNKKQPQMSQKENKAQQVLETVRWFDELQIIIKPKQYGIKFTNFLINFLQQQECPKPQIDFLVDEIMTEIFPNYTLLYDVTPLQNYQYPLNVNDFINQNTDFDKVAHELLLLVQNPQQLYNNLQQLNCLIEQATLKEEIHSLIYQMYFNAQKYQEQLLQEILKIIYQLIFMVPNEIQLTMHSILKQIYVKNTERQCLIDLFRHIQGMCNINLQHQKQLQFKGISMIDYLISSYIEDSQNQIKLYFNQQQLEAIKNMIVSEKLDVDETIQNIIDNYQIILDSKEYYNDVNEGIQNIQQGLIDNKQQLVSLGEKIIEYNQFLDKLRVTSVDLMSQKNLLQNQLNILKDKDVIIKEQLDKSNKTLRRPIHHGIKIYDLGFFKSLSKFNPISYFASKITLIQLGIYSITPDIIEKHLGSQAGLKKLENLTINNLTLYELQTLQRLLIDFNENNSLSKFQNRAISNLIQRSFRIFNLGYLKTNNIQFNNLRTDLLQKQRVIRNNINIINSVKIDLDLQVLSRLESMINLIKKEINSREDSDSQNIKNVDQFQDLQLLQTYINKLQSFDTIDLCIQLINQKFTKSQEVQINKQQQDELWYLSQIQYKKIPICLLKEQTKFNLLLIYLQDQYKNNQPELKRIYENKGLFKQFKSQIVIDAITYWSYYNKVARTNINIIMGGCSYLLFYNDYGTQVQAICIQSEHYLIDHQPNTNYQIRVLYEILHNKYGSFTLSVILQFLKQVINIQSKIDSIYDILNHQIIIDAQNEIKFKEFQQEVQEMLNCQIKEFVK